MSGNLEKLAASISLDDLRQFVKCPICNKLPKDGRAFTCENSHMICGSCLDRVQTMGKACPQGKCKYTTPPLRNRQVEDIIGKHYLKYSCPRSESGCTFKGPSKDATEDHETKSCPLRTYSCPYGSGCGKDVAIQDFSKHMMDAHNKETIPVASSWNVEFVIQMEVLRSPTPSSWFIVPFSLEGKGIFFAYLHNKDGLFHLWVHSVGDQDMAERIMVEIRLSGGGSELRCECRPLPIEIPMETALKDNKNRIEASWNLLERFTILKDDATGTRGLWVNVKVQKRD